MGDRRIGVVGTLARVVIGLAFLWLAFRWYDPGLPQFLIAGATPVVVGAVLLVLRQGDAEALRWTGPVGHVVNLAIFFAYYALTPGAALLFYGASMLVAAVRGLGGCELFAVSNVVRGRTDEIGCTLLLPFDAVESAVRR